MKRIGRFSQSSIQLSTLLMLLDCEVALADFSVPGPDRGALKIGSQGPPLKPPLQVGTEELRPSS